MSIVEAVDKLNQHEHICNLVIIGRDEDNIKINSKHTLYLGEQPREVVLAALKNSYALVSMSESESFGIVIVEAWMQKKPVIINQSCPAFSELVQNNTNGLYATKENLHQQMQTLLHNKDLASSLGENGLKICYKYQWKTIARQINNTLQQA